MPRANLIAVITTIQPPTLAVRALTASLRPIGAPVLIVGDSKGPSEYDLPGADFLSLGDQLKLGLQLPRLLPVGHYSRKNVGYLIAIARRASSIYETDDDNAPLPTFRVRTLTACAQPVQQRKWFNVYQVYTKELVWPRGFPLESIRGEGSISYAPDTQTEEIEAPIQQGLANGSPDVDAIWRLVLEREISFSDGPSVWLPPRTWCPFNSQSTWWWPIAFPLMYLPSHCSFRMTDIWRSFIAQRCLWELGAGLVFHPAEVLQQRNVHRLLCDFRDELAGYLSNHEIVEVLSGLALDSGPSSVRSNLVRCYQALIASEFIPAAEMPLLRAWLDDLDCVRVSF